jgi:hypothetical protein
MTMNTNILLTASALSDHELLARLEGLAGKEREASAELVAHLAALDSRPSLFAAQGYGSLFSYCTHALQLSEDAACNRIEAARACRRFPLILDLLASGSLSQTSVRLLGPHLTAENHESVLARARDRRRREIEALIAELAPRPDVASTVRKVPCRNPTRQPGSASGLGPAMTSVLSAAEAAIAPSPSPLPATPRPIVEASAPERYYVRFTIGQETHEKLRRLQALLRREIPDGDPGAIFDRAITLLLEKVEKTKLGAAVKPRPSRAIRPATDPIVPIRPAADKEGCKPALLSGHVRPALPSGHVPPSLQSRTLPREVKCKVWARDAGQCAFVSSAGRRCTEGTFLEYHHVQPHAKQGPATVANISLRCWRHNQYEAELVFGPHGPATVRETRPSP